MNKEFEMAIYEYYNIIKDKCEFLIKNLNLLKKNNIKNKYDLFSYLRDNKISGFQFDGNNYIFHGCGCTVFFNDVIVADWDFGFRSLWCGIDSYKMSLTLKNNGYVNHSFYNADFIRDLCESYIAQGDLILYKNQYYVNLLKKGTIKTKFPDIYDELIVYYSGEVIIFNKSKDIDRFIRKSREIYKDIDKLDNNSMLVFRYNNKVVYKVLYNDIAYPDSAVEIMTNKILKPHILKKSY